MESEHLESYLAGELDELGRLQVERVLRNDAALRSSFLRQRQMDAVLQVILGEGACAATGRFNRSVMARLRSEGAGDHRSFAKSVLTEIVEEREGVGPVRWPDVIKTAVVSAAATVALMFLFQKIIFNQSPAPPRGGVAAGFVASVEGGEELRWAGESAGRVRADGWLESGPLEIESGAALFAFNSGATAMVEGPARLSIESSNRLYLEEGRLTADVPPAASGFTVNTPRLTAVDIGTRFGVIVEENGDSELHVMEGLVEASRSSGNTASILVEEGLAVRADERTRSELRPVAYAGDSFVLRLGRPGAAVPALRYTFDESSGPMVEDSGLSGLYDIPLVASGELDSSPRRSAGKRGGALVFRPGETLSARLSREFRVEEPHTVAFWVKLPPRSVRHEGEIQMLRFGPEGGGWTMACNLDAADGAKGALRIGFGGGYAVGTTDIADGNWHHVAYRFIGGRDAGLPSHLHLFVDGAPEALSGHRPATVSEGRAGSLRMGGDEHSGLHGWIDELNIFRQAVPTPSLQTLTE